MGHRSRSHVELTPELAARFWAKVARASPDECWLWTGSLNVYGYGHFRLNGSVARSHRVAFLLTHGELPAEVYILHSCDQRPCCNPAHLRAGSQSENVKEEYARFRRDPRAIALKGWATRGDRG